MISKKFLLLFLCLLCLSGCDCGTHVINKISGHDESCDDCEPAKIAYHEESKQVVPNK
jgi:hypothetical protein